MKKKEGRKGNGKGDGEATEVRRPSLFGGRGGDQKRLNGENFPRTSCFPRVELVSVVLVFGAAPPSGHRKSHQ